MTTSEAGRRTPSFPDRLVRRSAWRLASPVRRARLATTCGIVLLGGVGLGSVSSTTAAQARQPGWLPREVHLTDGLTATQRAEAMATLDRLERLLRQVPQLATPDGFEIQPVIGGGARQMGPKETVLTGSVAEYALTLMFFAPSRARAGEGCGCLSIRVNPRLSGRLADAQGRIVYIEDARAMKPRGTPQEVAGTLWEVPSATQVYGELWEPSRDIREGRGERSGISVLFVRPGELPWLPVSRETFYEAIRIEQEGADGRKLDGFRAGLATTPYQQWMAEAPIRKEHREQAIAAARQSQPPAEVEALRKTLEDTERQVTEELRRREAEDRERNQEGLGRVDAMREAMRLELERMTPDERRMPTYINNALEEGPNATGWRLTSDPSPPAWRVLTPNPAFWRARRSPTEVRSITVQIAISGTGLQPRVRNALLEAFKRLDWRAIRDLVDTAR